MEIPLSDYHNVNLVLAVGLCVHVDQEEKRASPEGRDTRVLHSKLPTQPSEQKELSDVMDHGTAFLYCKCNDSLVLVHIAAFS